MLSFNKPSDEAVRGFLSEQSKLSFSYAAVGATATTPPPGYDVDRNRVKLGSGEKAFEAAKSALRHWEHFNLGWVQAWPTSTPIQKGEVVAILGHAFGMWWRNSCRIIYVVDESGPVSRFGFGYGTLPGHVESGEERFMIEWNRADDSVWYDILAFSKPNHFLARIGYLFVRRAQNRFAKNSMASMLNAVSQAE